MMSHNKKAQELFQAMKNPETHKDQALIHILFEHKEFREFIRDLFSITDNYEKSDLGSVWDVFYDLEHLAFAIFAEEIHDKEQEAGGI